MSLSDERLNIDTPENVQIGYELAGIGSRFMAALVDTTLLVLLLLLVWAAVLGIVFLTATDVQVAGNTAIMALAVLLNFIFLWGFYIFFEILWNGQTPGKRWVGLRVIRANGLPVTVTEVIIRNLVRIIDFLPLAYGFGVVTMFINPQSRRLGDLAAGTIVVFDQTAVTLKSLGEAVREPLGSQLVISNEVLALPTDRLTAADVAPVETFLKRRYELGNRAAMGAQLLRQLFERMEAPVPQVSSAQTEQLLQEIVYVVQRGDSS
ncbi:MAG: RDD family protein [Anaerolineales bacterium]|nr:RDD family protein [Anaerolineales bacterium]